MKIAIDCRFWGIKDTGLGRYTQNLVENLQKIDKKNEYILLKDQLINVPPYSLKEQVLLPKALKKVKPDLVHFPHFNVPLFSPFPYIVTIHDLIKHQFKGRETTTRNPWIYLLKYWGYKQVFKNSIKKAKKIIVPSNFVKKQILKYYSLDESKIKVIYEGVDEKLKKLRNKEKAIGKYKVKKPYILFVGNVYPHKNIERLILAVKKINQKSFLNLVIVCSRDVFYNRLKNKVKEFKAEKFVQLPNSVPDQELAVLYSQAKTFASPSLMEGFGLPGLEAMANNCPVVCSNIATFKEVYGQSVIYFNPRNIDDMAEKILKAVNFSKQEKERLIEKGKKQVKKYSWKKCAQETLKIYESCFSL